MAGWFVIIRRGAAGRFGARATAFQTEPDVTICWDRRQGERRTQRIVPQHERRLGRARRGRPPMTWDALDFLVTDQPDSRAR